MRRNVLFVGAAALGLVLALPASSPAADLSGDYSCKGTNANGREYKGTVTISKLGGCYHLTWVIAGQEHHGLGLVQDNVLAVTWEVTAGGSGGGIVAYKLLKDGTLEGRWAEYSDKPIILTETLTPSK